MVDSLEWIGQHTYGAPSAHGMLGGISLTAVHGMPVADLLLQLGAGQDQISAAVAHRDFDRSGGAPCMYGTSGDWSYVLEDRGRCTWAEWFHDGGNRVDVGPEEQLICLNANTAVNPSYLAYAPGDGGVHVRNFGDDLTSYPQAVPGGGLARLGQRLKSAGAVCPPGYTIPQWHALLEDSCGGLNALVWQTIGEALGIRIPRAQVEAGQLSAVRLAGPYD
jgi:hypothetical protein